MLHCIHLSKTRSLLLLQIQEAWEVKARCWSESQAQGVDQKSPPSHTTKRLQLSLNAPGTVHSLDSVAEIHFDIPKYLLKSLLAQ